MSNVPSSPPLPKARCYMEFCCNAASHDVVVADRSGTGRIPIPWGWCSQHVPVNR